MRWRFAPPARTELGAPLRRAHLHRWILYGDRLVQSELTGRQIELLLEGYVRHLRGWKVRDTQVLWPGGLAVTLPEKGSLMESLNLAADGAPLERHRAYPVWLTVWHRYGGAGLAAQALLRPGPEWGRSDATLRAGLFAWLSDPALALPPQCARWLEH
jgi:hypothetical protein